MLVLLLIGLGVGGVGLAVSRSRAGVAVPPQPPAQQPPADQGQVQSAPPAAPPAKPPTASTPGRAAPPQSKDSSLSELGEAGLVGALGAALGAVAAVGAVDTKEGKAAAPAIGAGLALGAYFANVGGVAAATGLSATLGAFAVIALPILEATYAIVVVVDQIIRFAKSQQWREMATKIRELREAGQFREALKLYIEVAPGIEPVARIWPAPSDAWWNAADQLGRPYPGFPGPPRGATAAEVQRWPQLVPETIELQGPGGVSTHSVAALLDAAYQDALAARAWLLTTSTPGVDATGKTVTSGPRDVRNAEPYRAALQLADDWARKIAAGAPWLRDWQLVDVRNEKGEVTGAALEPSGGAASNALVRDVRDATEKAVDAAKRAAFDAKTATAQASALARAAAVQSGTLKVSTAARVATVTGRPAPPPLFREQVAAANDQETQASRRTSTTTSSRTEAADVEGRGGTPRNTGGSRS